jgi:hypothetical protein
MVSIFWFTNLFQLGSIPNSGTQEVDQAVQLGWFAVLLSSPALCIVFLLGGGIPKVHSDRSSLLNSLLFIICHHIAVDSIIVFGGRLTNYPRSTLDSRPQ